MKKYLVDIYLPSTGVHYDAYLPAGKKIGEATELLAGMMEKLTNHSYKSSEHSLLLRADNGEVLQKDITVFASGICNAAKLILI